MARRLHIALAAATALAALAVLAAAPVAGARACAGAAVAPRATTTVAAESAALCLVNRQRSSRGLRALRANSRLVAAARDHSRDMVRRAYFEHGPFVTRILGHGYASGLRVLALGENLAWGTGPLATPAAIVDSWMHSPGHRANILQPAFREAGSGVAVGVPAAGLGLRGATYTFDFGARG